MNRAAPLFQAQLEAKRGEEHLRSAFGILMGIDGAPEKVKAEAKASWLRVRQAVATFPPAIRAVERGNVVFMIGRRRAGRCVSTEA
jgi:hypothetical protein